MNALEEHGRKTALRWLEIYLDDRQNLEELWGNYLEAAFEEPPVTRIEFDDLIPQVFEALRNSQPLPEMDWDVRHAIKQYLEDSEDTIWTSEYENNKEYGPTDDWTDAVLGAYRDLYQPLSA